jgi:hypothetical protein
VLLTKKQTADSEEGDEESLIPSFVDAVSRFEVV